MGQRLESVRSLYLEGIRDGNARAAIEKYTGHRYTQHSTGVPDGQAGFVEFFEEFIERNPKRDIQILRGIEDGRYAFVHAYQSLNDGAAQWVTMDLFDTDSSGRIIEHWDVIQKFSEGAPGSPGMIDGESDVRDREQTDANKEQVLEFTKQVLQGRKLEYLDQFVGADLIQHSRGIPPGFEGLRSWLEENRSAYEMLFKLIGEGHFVVTYGKRHAQGKDFAVFDLYRLEGGLIVEHWDTVEEILSRDAWGNVGKF